MVNIAFKMSVYITYGKSYLCRSKNDTGECKFWILIFFWSLRQYRILFIYICFLPTVRNNLFSWRPYPLQLHYSTLFDVTHQSLLRHSTLHLHLWALHNRNVYHRMVQLDLQWLFCHCLKKALFWFIDIENEKQKKIKNEYVYCLKVIISFYRVPTFQFYIFFLLQLYQKHGRIIIVEKYM